MPAHSHLRSWALIGLMAIATACSDDSSPNAADSELAFSDLRVEEISAGRAVIRFSTSRPTTCEAEYGRAANRLDQIAVDPNMGPDAFALDDEVSLEDLTPGTIYYYRARAVDAEGRIFLSTVDQFTTEPLEQSQQPLVNVALRTAGTTVADVSSNFGGADIEATWGAYQAIDGQMATAWATHGDGDSAFVTLDLGRQRTLVRFGFRSRQMADGSSIVTRVRLLFDDSSTAGPFDTPDPGQVYLFDLTPSVTTRTVRVETVASTGGNTGAREIQLFSAEE